MRAAQVLALAALALGCGARSWAAAQPQVHIGDPVLVVEGPAAEKRWGRYQFPRMYPLADGGMVVFVHVEADAAEAYGLSQRAFVSHDQGRTWKADDRAASERYGLHLPNGDWFLIETPRALPAVKLSLPRSAGETKNYGEAYTMYRLRDLPPELRLIFFRRFSKSGEAWRTESTELDDPEGFRYTVSGLFPRIWWGDMRVARDGSLLALVYPGMVQAGQRFYCTAASYRSTNQGKTWKLSGRVAYTPDLQADAHGEDRNGFTEPALEVLKDGSLLGVMRTDDGLGRGPMYLSRSRDMGKSWSKPAAFTRNGVMPRLLLLKNGTMVLSAGRPGLDLRFSFDGRGAKWSDPYPLVPVTSQNAQEDSCGYSDLLPLDANSFLVVYSWFKRPGADGQVHKSILVRRVEVR